jgi:NADPH:quinone reductase-like Zn-dependent oxidoreductase
MRAITCTGYGDPNHVLHLGEVDEPTVADDQVLVEVHAASINPADWHLIRGMPYIARLQIGLRRPPFTVPGSDFAGRVVATGASVTRVAVGDDVFGSTFMAGFGAFAERVAVAEHLVARMPSALGYDDAAAVPLAALTALQALRDHGQLEPGHRVLIIGASGGVGTFAVQIANALGAEVTGVCSTSNVELVRTLGADRVIDYTTPGAWEEVGEHDLVVQLGGTQTASECRRFLNDRGTLLQLSGDSSSRWFGPLGRVISGRLLSASANQTIATFTVQANANDLDTLAGLIDDGALIVSIDVAYPLDQAGDAVRHLESGHRAGKVVLQTIDTHEGDLGNVGGQGLGGEADRQLPGAPWRQGTALGATPPRREL